MYKELDMQQLFVMPKNTSTHKASTHHGSISRTSKKHSKKKQLPCPILCFSRHTKILKMEVASRKQWKKTKDKSKEKIEGQNISNPSYLLPKRFYFLSMIVPIVRVIYSLRQ